MREIGLGSSQESDLAAALDRVIRKIGEKEKEESDEYDEEEEEVEQEPEQEGDSKDSDDSDFFSDGYRRDKQKAARAGASVAGRSKKPVSVADPPPVTDWSVHSRRVVQKSSSEAYLEEIQKRTAAKNPTATMEGHVKKEEGEAKKKSHRLPDRIEHGN